MQYTRELKDIGVSIYFEKEKLDTASVTSEFLLTIFAAFAQEESHSISENTKRGIRNRFKLGQPRYAKILRVSADYLIGSGSDVIINASGLEQREVDMLTGLVEDMAEKNKQLKEYQKKNN